MNNNNTLEDLSLSGNSLGHAFCKSLAGLLLVNTSLKKLDLSSNFIEDDDTATLKNSLESNRNVIELDIRNNPKLSEGKGEKVTLIRQGRRIT